MSIPQENQMNRDLVMQFSVLPEAALIEMAKDPAFLPFVEMARQMKAEELAASDRCAFNLSRFITQHHAMLKLKEQVRLLANVDDAVLILGESGTGKELIANALHGRRAGEFIAINCAGMPEHLIESELFGHVRGAFTDAKADKIGIMEAAAKGTVFLDEIGDMPLALQSKLLRALQEKKIRKVGGNVMIDIDCRIVAATHQPLLQLIEERRFRSDLYWRIATFELVILGLSMRRDDVPLILASLDTEKRIKDYVAFANKISPSELAGNVRSLQRIIRRYYLFNEFPSK